MHSDGELIQIVDAALAEAVHKSGAWLVCRPGCWECCVGPFPITQLDAARLRDGLADLQTSDPARADRVRARSAEWASREDDALEETACPVLDPETGTCDLYAVRPLTCRLFGPPIRWSENAVGVCELCFDGATDEEIAACEVRVDLTDREDELVAAQERLSGVSGQTTVALALLA